MTTDKLFTKSIVAGICIFFAGLVFCRYYFTRNYKDIIELSILLISAFLIFIKGNKLILPCLIIFVASVMHLDHKSLYASLLVFTITAFINRNYLIPLAIIYHINLVVVLCFSQDILNVNVIIFYSVCIIVFLMILFYPKINPRHELILTEDEKSILDELIKGKQQKEIDLFSKNTITDKLKAAYKRNNLMDKNELIFLYKWEQSQ